MTETLKSALHQHADAPMFDAPDLVALHRRGQRALRRRRAGLVAGGMVIASLAVAATTLTIGSDPRQKDSVPVAQDPSAEDVAVVWAEGSTLYSTTEGETDLGHRAVALVRTSAGSVFADEAGAVYSVSKGEVTQVGSTDPDSIRLVSDPFGPRAVWLDEEGTRIVSYDQATGADLVLDRRLGGDQARLTALDGHTAYAMVGGEARSVNLLSGAVRVVAADGSEVLDATDGLLALGSDSQVKVSGGPSATVLRDDFADVGTFSPDGTWFSSDADEPQVTSTATGNRIDFDVPDFFATGYEWIDPSTLVMITQEADTAPLVLLTCEVPAGTCRPAVELGTSQSMAERGLVLPVGLPADL